jgi:hypothetical protein
MGDANDHHNRDRTGHLSHMHFHRRRRDAIQFNQFLVRDNEPLLITPG